MPDATYLPPGSLLADRYEIAGELGRGGFSVVYRAHDRRTSTDVAIKLLVPPPAAARVAQERLRREVQAVRTLQHPNIVAVYDVAESGPWSFVVMALEGPDLAVRVRQRGPLDPPAAAQVGRDVAAALQAAHAKGILHRDVKPQNILLGSGDRALLTDFGSARLAGQVTLTQTGGMVGTLAFAAPEVLARHRGDGRADTYALGLTLFFALTGELPRRNGGQAAAEPEDGYRVRDRRPDVPDWLDAAIARATALDPDDRFPSAELFALALSADTAPDGLVPTTRAARDRCVLCHAADPFGLGVCSRCARRAAGRGDVLVFVDRTSPGSPRRAVEDALETRLAAWTGRASREAVVRGERPLLRVPAGAGPRVLDTLEACGLPAHTQVVGALWRSQLPGPILLLGAVVALGGSVTGLAAGLPALLLTSPLVAVGLVGTAAVGRRLPVWNPPPAGTSPLDPPAQRAAAEALAALPPGQARRLLVDLLRRAAATAGRGGGDVTALVVAACTAAADLAALEQHLRAFDEVADSADPSPD